MFLTALKSSWKLFFSSASSGTRFMVSVMQASQAWDKTPKGRYVTTGCTTHRAATPETSGIRDKPTAPASPWQNGFAERMIGSIRRECVDHIIVLGEAHLRRVLRSYARYYNDIRTHRH
jgi:transposase InsO family protein